MLFINGSEDPWHKLSLLESREEEGVNSAKAHLIDGKQQIIATLSATISFQALPTAKTCTRSGRDRSMMGSPGPTPSSGNT